MKSTNKKILQTKQSLRNALWSLIDSKDIQDITVSEVCHAANINRTTFYKYYSIPFDILREYVEEICEQALIQISKKYDTSSERNIYIIMLDICRIYYGNKHMMKVFMECNKFLLPIVQQVFEGDLRNGLMKNSLNSFISGGVTSIIFQWSLSGYQQLPEEIAEILTTYIVQLYATSD